VILYRANTTALHMPDGKFSEGGRKVKLGCKMGRCMKKVENHWPRWKKYCNNNKKSCPGLKSTKGPHQPFFLGVDFHSHYVTVQGSVAVVEVDDNNVKSFLHTNVGWLQLKAFRVDCNAVQ